MDEKDNLGIDLRNLSDLISKKVNREIKIIKIEKIGGGYHSDGFKLSAENGKSFFLKKLKSHDLGFEFPERKLASLLVGHNMADRVHLSPLPVEVILANKNKIEHVPELSEDTAIYQIQEFEDEGIDYWTLIEKKKDKKAVDSKDLEEISKIVDYIYRVHSIKHQSRDEERLKAIYNDSLRAVLTHPELSLMFLFDFPYNHPILPKEKQKEYIVLAWELFQKWKDRYDRLSALHGDFWGANFFFKKDGSVWVIDYSRIPWGDPGIDIGWWFGQYLWFYHETGNNYFQKLGEKFLNAYIEKTKDEEIVRALSLAMIFIGIVYITPRFHPELTIETGKRFFINVLEIIKNNKLIWTA